MKLINHILYIEFAELVACEISESTLKWAKAKQSSCWSFIKDPADKRKVLVEYEALKPMYKELVMAKYGNPYQQVQHQAIKDAVKYDYEAFKYYSNKYSEIAEGHADNYITAAGWLNMLCDAKLVKQLMKATGCQSKEDFYTIVIQQINLNGVKLPQNYHRLMEKKRKYQAEGYESLIKRTTNNTNAVKITEEVADWLIAQYSLPIKKTCEMLWTEYVQIAPKRGWKPLKDSRSIYGYLHQPEIIREWTGPRDGFIKYADQQYRYPLRTKLPTMRDSLWYSDGTKLNFFDSVGKLKAAWTVYEVIDVYSEVLVGYHIAPTENYISQYHAFKMAIGFSQCKPYELRYDNQGGHKKLKDFLDKLTRVGFKTRPNNGKSKTIENIFGRLQSQVMRKLWFFTGQNITARKTNSKANMEFVIKNLKHLPSPEQIMKEYANCREIWNNSMHPTLGIPRIQAYNESMNTGTEPMSYLEMVETFWLRNKKQITYRNEGITFENNRQVFEYEVLTQDKMPDAKFRAKNIGRSFTIKYDPADMSHIRLYTETPNGLQFIAIAETRLTVHRAIQDYDPNEGERIRELLDFGNEEAKSLRNSHKNREDRTGIRAEDLVMTLAQYQKAESYKDAVEDEVTDWRDLI